MGRWTLNISENATYSHVVEARDEAEAREIGEAMVADGDILSGECVVHERELDSVVAEKHDTPLTVPAVLTPRPQARPRKLPYKSGDIVLWLQAEGGGGGSGRVASAHRARWAVVQYCTAHRVCIVPSGRDGSHTFVRPEAVARPPYEPGPEGILS